MSYDWDDVKFAMICIIGIVALIALIVGLTLLVISGFPAGFNTVIVRQLFHSRTDNPTTGAGAFSMNLRESTGSTGTYAAITDAVGANNATVSLGVQDLASGTASQGLIYCDLRNRDRYLKANIDLTTGSTGGAALGDLSIDFLLCNSKIVKPVTQTAITSAT